MKNISILKDYDNFHKFTQVQRKIVTEDNFTYFRHIKIINMFKLGKQVNVLDYGCGAGTISYYLANKKCNVYGYDLSSLAIRNCNNSKRLLGLKNIQFSTNKPIKKNHFDLIVCFEVLEHIKNEKKIIEFFFKSLKKGGSLILSVPSKNAPLYRAGLLKNFDLIVGHLRRYTKNEITNVLTWGGFKIDTIFFEESILRNLFYTTPLMGNIIRFIKGPLVHLFFAIDKVLVKLFGESDLIIIGVK